jgi:hypothetical protein
MRTAQSVTIRTGKQIRSFGAWYRHDYVSVDGIELMGFIQVRRRNGRIESTTHFQFLSSAVLGTDADWLYRQNKAHEQELIAKGMLCSVLPEGQTI